MNIIAIIKDLFISILIVIAIVAILVFIFYDDVSLARVIPESEEYVLTEEMQEAIKKDELEEIEEVVTKYYIDSTDLKKYEKTKEYNKGKKNPFAVESTPSNNENIGAEDKNSNTSSENFYEDDGTK